MINLPASHRPSNTVFVSISQTLLIGPIHLPISKLLATWHSFALVFNRDVCSSIYLWTSGSAAIYHIITGTTLRLNYQARVDRKPGVSHAAGSNSSLFPGIQHAHHCWLTYLGLTFRYCRCLWEGHLQTFLVGHLLLLIARSRPPCFRSPSFDGCCNRNESPRNQECCEAQEGSCRIQGCSTASHLPGSP